MKGSDQKGRVVDVVISWTLAAAFRKEVAAGDRGWL